MVSIIKIINYTILILALILIIYLIVKLILNKYSIENLVDSCELTCIKNDDSMFNHGHNTPVIFIKTTNSDNKIYEGRYKKDSSISLYIKDDNSYCIYSTSNDNDIGNILEYSDYNTYISSNNSIENFKKGYITNFITNNEESNEEYNEESINSKFYMKGQNNKYTVDDSIILVKNINGNTLYKYFTAVLKSENISFFNNLNNQFSFTFLYERNYITLSYRINFDDQGHNIIKINLSTGQCFIDSNSYKMYYNKSILLITIDKDDDNKGIIKISNFPNRYKLYKYMKFLLLSTNESKYINIINYLLNIIEDGNQLDIINSETIDDVTYSESIITNNYNTGGYNNNIVDIMSYNNLYKPTYCNVTGRFKRLGGTAREILEGSKGITNRYNKCKRYAIYKNRSNISYNINDNTCILYDDEINPKSVAMNSNSDYLYIYINDNITYIIDKNIIINNKGDQDLGTCDLSKYIKGYCSTNNNEHMRTVGASSPCDCEKKCDNDKKSDKY